MARTILRLALLALAQATNLDELSQLQATVQSASIFNSKEQAHEQVIVVPLVERYHEQHLQRYSPDAMRTMLKNHSNDQISMTEYLQLAEEQDQDPKIVLIDQKRDSNTKSKVDVKKSKLKQYDVDSKLDTEDDNGGFEDSKQAASHNIFDQRDNKHAFRTPLLNARDVSYLGPVFIGTPKSQGAMVVYDTGSDWLTVKACLTDQHCHLHVDKEKTIEKYGDQGKKMSEEEEDATPEAKPADPDDPNSAGDGVARPFASEAQEKASKATGPKPVMSPDVVYSANKSMTGGPTTNIAFPLSYGSADLEGFKFADTVCLNPIAYTSLAEVTPKRLDQHFCVSKLKYQAIITSKGLDGCDGILGLSPKDYGEHSLLPALKRGGMINRLLISFSNAFHRASFKSKFYPDSNSYMIFGGVNETQIVGGADGLYAMPLAEKALNPHKFWGVEGQGFMYGDTFYHDPEQDQPILSVIDSGTTLVMIPYKSYDGVMMGIAKKVKDDPTVAFVCTRDEKTKELGACYFNNTRCEDITDKLEPMRFIFGGIVYEIKIQAFLKDVTDSGDLTAPPPPVKPGEEYTGGCMFELRPSRDKNEPENSQERRFLMGNTFLKNFVSVYDYDQQEVKLGVNIHSESLAKAYPYKKGMFDKK